MLTQPGFISRKAFWLPSLVAIFLIGLTQSTVFADEPTRRPRTLLEELQRPAFNQGRPEPTLIIESIWPGHPEWLAMAAEIMAGNQLSASTGWYRKAVGQSRFEWKAVRDRWDKNGDKRLSRSEWPFSESDFDRLDLNHDGLLSAIDFSILPRHEPLSRVGSEYAFMAFAYADKNRDDRVSPAEVSSIFFGHRHPIAFDLILESIKDDLKYKLEQVKSEPRASITLADYQSVFELAARRGTLPNQPLGDMVPVGASAQTLMTGFLKQEIGAWGAGPSLNDLAPDFSLPASDGRSEIELSSLIGEKPLVLVFGNFTCGPFRGHAASIEALVKRYGDRANFLVVYTRESHPKEGWVLNENRWAKVEVSQPHDLASRVRVAQTCRQSMKLDVPMVVDTMDDRVARTYSGPPSRLYLIDREGKIAYKGGRGPFGFKPFELEQSLILLLNTENRSDAKTARAASTR